MIILCVFSSLTTHSKTCSFAAACLLSTAIGSDNVLYRALKPICNHITEDDFLHA